MDLGQTNSPGFGNDKDTFVLDLVRLELCAPAGSFLIDDILSSQPRAEQYLDHPDVAIRFAALYAIAHLGDSRGKQLARQACEELLSKESNLKLRQDALGCLIVAMFNTKDLSALRLLRELARDNTQPVEFRCLAYQGIHVVEGMTNKDPEWQQVSSIQSPAEFDFRRLNRLIEEGEE